LCDFDRYCGDGRRSPCPSTGGAQAPAGRGGRGSAPAIFSPDVHKDRTVTLRLNAPKATEVTLSGNITVDKPTMPMTKDEKGVWSITVGPLEPDIYEYSFVVD
jgi:hypothetical protein